MLSEIGSNFWINPNESFVDKPLGTPKQFGCEGVDYVWLSTGRSAISFAIKTIEENNPLLKKKVALPPFTCHTVIEPFLRAGYNVYYYPIEENMVVSSDAIMKIVKEQDASIVLFHRYFGFSTLDSQIDELCDTMRAMGKYTIEDCTQCLYSIFPKSCADFFVGSIRKWHGTPDGGFVVSRKMFLGGKPTKTDERLEKAKTEASYAKYNYMFNHEGDKSTFLQMYRKAEDILIEQNEFRSICKTSCILQSNLAIDLLIDSRRRNFKTLLAGMTNLAEVDVMFDEIPDNVVPLYFPIFVNDRSALQKELVKHNIYAPVVWPKADCLGEVCETAESLYNHLLCIPVDQRYDSDDMKYILETIINFYGNE